MTNNKGFTLIELLIVIGIIAILAAAVIITITPGQRLAEARNATRHSHLNSLSTAIYMHIIDEGDVPTGITSTLKEICNTNLLDPTCGDMINLSGTDISVPVDPHAVDSGTGYEVAYQDGRLAFNAKHAEDTTIAIGGGGESPTWACGDNITDTRDEQTYSTAEIAGLCWMTENLKYLPSVVGSATGSETTPYYYVYDYQGTDVSAAKSSSNYQTYGALYNHPAAVTACPEGWYLPSDTDYYNLENAYSSSCDSNRTGWGCDPAGTAMKTSSWTGDNSSGFTALPAGFFYPSGSFAFLGSGGFWWSSSSLGFSAWRRVLNSSYSTVDRALFSQALGLSVRCARDL